MGTFFTIGAVGDPPALLLTAGDDLDLRTVDLAAEELDTVTRSGGPPVVVVDVTDRFVGAHGMQVLVEAVKRAGGRLCAVAGLHPELLSRLDLFDAEGLPFFAGLHEAVAVLPSGRDARAGG